MECIQGKSIFAGIAIGRIEIYKEKKYAATYVRTEDVSTELSRFEQACRLAQMQLQELYEQALPKVGEAQAQVFEAQKMFLFDEEYKASVIGTIESKHTSAEYAVDVTGKWYADKLYQLEDEYLRERSQDVRDVSDRVLSILISSSLQSAVAARKTIDQTPVKESYQLGNDMKPRILLATELTPGQTMQMDKERIHAFVTEIGSANSHSAILARAMNIPAITGIKILAEWDGKLAAVDGYTGCFYIEPDEQVLAELTAKQRQLEQERRALENLIGRRTVTKSGKKIKLYANIASKEDVSAALDNDAEGVGLFRTEFLYMNRRDYPTEEEQFLLYKYVVESFAGKRVVIRSLDIGADKTVDYMGLTQEQNPALGYRAIRICLEHQEMFRTQLRAILRAATFGDVDLLLPMIISEEEIETVKSILEIAKGELKNCGKEYGNIRLGVMIETPAAVMISKELAGKVDFFSIGTNDLAQYTMAIDRQNSKLDVFYNPQHLALLRMIEMVIKNAHAVGIEVGICGEMAADLELTPKLLDMGIDELSVSPSMILPLREKICDIE